jgi:hypothetical protein
MKIPMKIKIDEVQEILYRFANRTIPKDSQEFQILIELLNNHPKASEKIGSGVDCFFVQNSKWKMNQFNFMIRRIDGTETDFSFYKCFSPKRERSKNINWSNIFREVIKNQVDSFRIAAFSVLGVNDKFICAETNLKFKKMYAHVDHVYPLTFDSIYLEFLKINNIDLSRVELSKDAGTSECQVILDRELRDKFSQFHNDRAILRLVCSTANLQAKKTKNYGGESPSILKENLSNKYPQYHKL